MTKTYKAASAISLNLVMKSGKSMHLSFMPLSNGTSVYTTSDEQIQHALERHYRYGKLFRLANVKETATARQGKAATASAATEKKAEKKLQHVKVSDWGKAKDYIADKTGISRSQLRSMQQIKAAAEAAGIVFDGLEKK